MSGRLSQEPTPPSPRNMTTSTGRTGLTESTPYNYPSQGGLHKIQGSVKNRKNVISGILSVLFKQFEYAVFVVSYCSACEIITSTCTQKTAQSMQTIYFVCACMADARYLIIHVSISFRVPPYLLVTPIRCCCCYMAALQGRLLPHG